MNVPNSYPVGSLVHHRNRPSVAIWVVIGRDETRHILRSFPDKRGEYEVIRGNGENLTLIVGVGFGDLEPGIRKIDTTGILRQYFNN